MGNYTVVGDKPSRPKIERLCAFVAVEPNGHEGICAVQANDRWFPLVASKPEIIELMKRQAQDIANETGQTIQMVEFVSRRELEVFTQK